MRGKETRRQETRGGYVRERKERREEERRGRGGEDRRQTVLGHNHVRLFRAAVSIVNIRERRNFISSVNITSLLLLCS